MDPLLQQAVKLVPEINAAYSRNLFSGLKFTVDRLEEVSTGLSDSFLKQIGESSNVG